jgi:hypothetical protein
MSVTAVTGADGTNGVIVRTTVLPRDHLDYGCLLFALLTLALIAGGLRKAFWNKDSN